MEGAPTDRSFTDSPHLLVKRYSPGVKPFSVRLCPQGSSSHYELKIEELNQSFQRALVRSYDRDCLPDEIGYFLWVREHDEM